MTTGRVKKKSKGKSVVTLTQYAEAANGPKPRRAYLAFFTEKHAVLKGDGQGRGLELGPKIAALWNDLGEKEKEKYTSAAAESMQLWKHKVEATKEALYQAAAKLALPPGWHEVKHNEGNGKGYSWYYHVDDSGKHSSQYGRPFDPEELDDINQASAEAKKKSAKSKKK